MLRILRIIQNPLCLLLATLFVSQPVFGVEKQAIYWRGNNLVDNPVLLTSVINRGFSHAVFPLSTSVEDIEEIQNAGISSILAVFSTDSVSWNIRHQDHSPFDNVSLYAGARDSLYNTILNYTPFVSGIVDDIEERPFNSYKYHEQIENSVNYGKSFIYDDEHSRIHNMGNTAHNLSSNWGGFKAHYPLYEGYTGDEMMSMENLQYCFPRPAVSQQLTDRGIFFGNGNTRYVAQTFIASSNWISGFSCKIARHTDGGNYSPSSIQYYLVETDGNDIPDLGSRITAPRSIRSDEVPLFNDPFALDEVEYQSYYFDPSETGQLDTDEIYAVVFECNNNVAGTRYVISTYGTGTPSGPSEQGACYFGDGISGWYILGAMQYSVLSPTSPFSSSELISQEDEGENYILLGYNEDYRKGAQTFSIQTPASLSAITLRSQRIENGGAVVLGILQASIQEVDIEGYPDDGAELASVDIPIDAIPVTGYSNYFDLEINLWAHLDPAKDYAIVLEYFGDCDTDAYYRFYRCAEATGGPYSGGHALKGDSAGWTHIYSDSDLYFILMKSDLAIHQPHDDWIEFQTSVNSWHVETYHAIVDQIFIQAQVRPDVYVYSGYSGVIYGGNYTPERYSVDWCKNAIAGLDYAICGYGTPNTTPTVSDLSCGVALLIGGALNAEDFTNRYNSCLGGAMYYYGVSGGDDPNVAVPDNDPGGGREIHNRQVAQGETSDAITVFFGSRDSSRRVGIYQIPAGTVGECSIFDLRGRLIERSQPHSGPRGAEVVFKKANQLSSGIYLLHVKSGGRSSAHTISYMK